MPRDDLPSPPYSASKRCRIEPRLRSSHFAGSTACTLFAFDCSICCSTCSTPSARCAMRAGAADPLVVDRGQHRGKSRPAELVVLRREIAAGVERLQVGRQEHVVGPATRTARDELRREHVDRVEIGPLLAVDLDVHEPLVHQLRDLGIREQRALRDMAPVARAVADRQEDRLVLALRFLKRLRPPWIPVDRVMRVQQQIRIVGVDQAIGMSALRCTSIRTEARERDEQKRRERDVS